MGREGKGVVRFGMTLCYQVSERTGNAHVNFRLARKRGPRTGRAPENTGGARSREEGSVLRNTRMQARSWVPQNRGRRERPHGGGNGTPIVSARVIQRRRVRYRRSISLRKSKQRTEGGTARTKRDLNKIRIRIKSFT